jgi:hypothetical protein
MRNDTRTRYEKGGFTAEKIVATLYVLLFAAIVLSGVTGQRLSTEAKTSPEVEVSMN